MCKKLHYFLIEWILPAMAYSLLCMFIGLMVNEAYADEYTPTFKWRSDSYSGFFPELDTYQEVLEDNKTKLNENGANYQLISTVVLNAASVYGNYSEGGATFQRGASRVAYCNYCGSLSGSVADNNQRCINAQPCPEGQTRLENGSFYVPPPTCEDKEWQVARSGLFEMGTSTTVFKTTGCLNQCMLRFDWDIPGKEQLVNGKYHYFAEGSFIYNGFDCAGGTGDAPPNSTGLPPPSCGNGKTMGQINGKTACVDSGDGKPQNPHTPQETEKTEKTKTENPDGSTTKTETTTLADGSSTTTTTTTNSDGSSTTTKTETPATGAGGAVSSGSNNGNNNGNEGNGQDKKVYICAENHDIPACKEIDSGEVVDVDGLYESQYSEDKTFKVVIQTFGDRVQNLSWFKSITGFFEVTMTGGSCGGLSGSVGFGGYSFDYDLDAVFCGSAALSMYQVLSIGVQLAATWVAFSIAFLF